MARTEAQLVAAAAELFLSQGYQATTLAAVTRRAGLAPRTVYLRFGSKATLFGRVVDQALAGDVGSQRVRDQPALREALSAPTLDARIRAFADYCVGIAERAGALFKVAQQAEGIEPDLAMAFQSGRIETLHLCTTFWKRARTDGLLDATLDLDPLTALTDILVCADTTVHLRRTSSWNASEHHALITGTLTTLTRDPRPA